MTSIKLFHNFFYLGKQKIGETTKFRLSGRTAVCVQINIKRVQLHFWIKDCYNHFSFLLNMRRT